MLLDPNAIGRRRWFQISLSQTSCIILQARKMIYLKNKNKIINLLFLNTFKMDPYQRKHEPCNILNPPPPLPRGMGILLERQLQIFLKIYHIGICHTLSSSENLRTTFMRSEVIEMSPIFYHLFIVRYQKDIRFLVLNEIK